VVFWVFLFLQLAPPQHWCTTTRLRDAVTQKTTI